MLAVLHRVVDHPLTNLVVAFILIGSAMSEAAGDLVEPLMRGDLRSHHGVFVFGLAQAAKAVPEVAEGLLKLFHGPEADDLAGG